MWSRDPYNNLLYVDLCDWLFSHSNIDESGYINGVHVDDILDSMRDLSWILLTAKVLKGYDLEDLTIWI